MAAFRFTTTEKAREISSGPNCCDFREQAGYEILIFTTLFADAYGTVAHSHEQCLRSQVLLNSISQILISILLEHAS
jgi:hypothetical protein